MKKILLKIYSVIISVFIAIRFKSVHNTNSIVFRTTIKGIKHNKMSLYNSSIKQSCIRLNGEDNEIHLQQNHLWKVNINITGNNNLIEISPNAKLNLAQIVLRGNDCNIKIGQGTTFGSAYIVCMGESNSIHIGDECMFAEHIEIWNTDSHPILDEKGNVTNPSKPISIGNHVWCGKGCKILKGVSIGNNAIIGMQSIVTKDIADGTLNVGIPARTIREGLNWNRNFITV